MDVSRKSWILMVLSWFSSMRCVIDMGFTGFYTVSSATPRSSSLKNTIYKQRFTMGRQEHHSNAKHNVNAWTMYLFISHRWSFSHSFSEPFSPPTFSHSFSEPFPTTPQKDPKRLSRLVRTQTNRIATTKVVATNFPISPSFPILSVGQMLPQFLLHFVFLRALLLLLFSLSLNGLLLLKSFALALGWSDELQRLPWGQGELVQQFNGEYTLR